MLPDETGGAADDGYLYRVSEHDYLLVVNAANTEGDWQWLQKYATRFPKLVLEDVTGQFAMLALQGPKTKKAIRKAAALTLRYSDEKEEEALVQFGGEKMDESIIVSALGASEIKELRIK